MVKFHLIPNNYIITPMNSESYAFWNPPGVSHYVSLSCDVSGGFPFRSLSSAEFIYFVEKRVLKPKSKSENKLLCLVNYHELRSEGKFRKVFYQLYHNKKSSEYQLGLHLSNRVLSNPKISIKISGLACSKSSTRMTFDKKDYKWMQKLNTFKPHGINVKYPFWINQ